MENLILTELKKSLKLMKSIEISINSLAVLRPGVTFLEGYKIRIHGQMKPGGQYNDENLISIPKYLSLQK